MQLNVFREGKELTSPSTGEVLGRLEEDLGTVTVTQVAETYAVAARTDAVGSATVQAGDKVRITAGRLSLVLLPVTGQTGRAMPLAALTDAVQRGLDATGRFYVVPRARLTMWLLERDLSPRDPLSSETLSEVASALGVAYVAQPILRDASDTMVVELRMFAPAQPQTPVSTALAILSEAEPIPQRPVAQPTVAVATPPVRPESPQTAVVSTLPVRTDGLTTPAELTQCRPSFPGKALRADGAIPNRVARF